MSMPASSYTRCPQWLIKELANCPVAGTGVHYWIFERALNLRRYCTSQQAEMILQEACKGVRRNTDREIRLAVQDAYRAAPIMRSHPKWPPRDDRKIAGILSNGFNEDQLRIASPCQYEGDAWTLLDQLFPGDPLLAIGFHNSEFYTLPKSEWQAILAQRRGGQFIVPSAMKARYGLTLEGKRSQKCKGNVGERQYLVVEFDFNPAGKPQDQRLLEHGRQFGVQNTRDMCACMIAHLARQCPLVLVVWSGGKSLHAWFHVGDAPVTTLQNAFAEAVSVGADAATWEPSQFVRLPCGFNKKTLQTQSVIFFNPAVLATHSKS